MRPRHLLPTLTLPSWNRIRLKAFFTLLTIKPSIIFSDLYDWAGQVRTVNISKKGTNFCPAENIEHQADLIFDRLKEQNYFKGLPHDEFVEKIVDFYCATNYLHPFREGNGRTQRAFLTQLIRNAGYDINWAEVDGDLLMIATIQAPQGVTNLLQQVFLGQILINDNQ